MPEFDTSSTPPSILYLDSVNEVEALAYSEVFEQLLFDNRIIRHAQCECPEIQLSPILQQSQFPEELRSIFWPSAKPLVFQNILAFQRIDEQGHVRSGVQLQVSNEEHTFVCEDGKTTYSGISLNGNKLRSELSKGTLQALLAMLVYAQQYDAKRPHVPLELCEDTLLYREDKEAGFTEQCIMTLGNHSGESSVTTIASLDTHKGTLLVDLHQIEKPNLSSLHNELQLGVVDKLTEDIIRHNAVQNGYSPRLENIFGERRNLFEEEPIFIDPDRDADEWATLCHDFSETIGNYMEVYNIDLEDD